MAGSLRTLVTSAIALVFVVLGLLAPSAITPTASATSPANQDANPPTLVLFTNGVNWEDINAEDTPHLAAWAASGTMFNIVPPNIRGWVCPRDVTLAMSAGEALHSRSVVKIADCPEPEFTAGEMPDAWDSWFYRMQLDGNYAPIGNVAASLIRAEIPYAAVGTAGATFLIGPDGKVADLYAPAAETDEQLATQVTALLTEANVVAVDASATDFAAEPSRAVATERRIFAEENPDAELEPIEDPAALAAASKEFAGETVTTNAQRADAVLAATEPGTRVYFISLTDTSGSSLQPGFVSEGPNWYASSVGADGTSKITTAGYRAYGWDPQVRQEGTIKFETLAATIVNQVGVDLTLPDWPNRLGTNIMTSRGAMETNCLADDACYTSRASELADASQKSAAITEVRGLFFQIMQWSAIVFLILCAVLFAPLDRTTRWERVNRGLEKLRGLRPIQKRFTRGPLWILFAVAGLTISAVPISSHIVSIVVPWWNMGNPKVTLIVATWLCALVLASLSFVEFVAFGKNRRPYAPYLPIAAVTAALLIQEVATGSQNLIDAPMGFNTLIGARFYGLGNEGFAVFAVSLLIALAFIPRISSRLAGKVGLILVGVLGLYALFVVVSPDKGADFGGALALTPSLALLLLLMSGKRTSWKKLLGLAVLAGGVAFGVALADWARGPESRTHLGSFVQSIFDGDAFEIIWRKLAVNLRLLTGSTHRWVVLAAIVAIVAVVVPLLRRLRSASDLALRNGLIAAGVCMILAFALNDSGIVLPGMGAIVSLPALLPLIARRGQSASATRASETEHHSNASKQ